jgi:hypothetical protein
MTQFMRPNSDRTASSIATSGSSKYLNIDEASATSGGGEQIDTTPLGAGKTAVYRCGLSDPTYGPAGGTTTVRYQAKANATPNIDLTVKVYERSALGSTLIATDTTRTLLTSFTNYSFTPDVSAITDWTQVELEFVFVRTAGTQVGSLSWAEMEIPNPGYVLSGGSFALTGGTFVAALLSFIVLAGGSFSLSGGALTLREKVFSFFLRGRSSRSTARNNSVRSRR